MNEKQRQALVLSLLFGDHVGGGAAEYEEVSVERSFADGTPEIELIAVSFFASGCDDANPAILELAVMGGVMTAEISGPPLLPRAAAIVREAVGDSVEITRLEKV